MRERKCVQQGVAEAKGRKRLERYFRSVLLELVKTVRAWERERDSRGMRVSEEQPEGGRRSGRKNIPTQRAEYVYTARTHGVLIDMGEEATEVSPGFKGLTLFQAHDDMRAASAIVGVPDLLDGHLCDGGVCGERRW